MIRWLAWTSQATAALLLALFSWRLWRNLDFLNFAGRATGAPAPPQSVSVLVPARNEARTIIPCVESLLAQQYADFEVLVLNDQSTDGTGMLLEKHFGGHPNLSIIHGQENPPTGWNGKSYACQRLADVARGDWLLFTDSDTLHMPTSIAQGVAQAEALGVDMLSVFPRQITASWSERIVVSFIVDFLPLLALDLRGLWQGTSGSTAANGQYLLLRRSSYEAMGGHSAIAAALVDDFALAQAMRSEGFRVALVDGTQMLHCRMYHNAQEVWSGFAKNILLALESSSGSPRARWWGLPFAWGYASLFVLPFALLLTPYRAVSLLLIGWLGILRGAVNGRFRRPALEVAWSPLAAWSVMVFGLTAYMRRLRGKPVRWKGRDYSLRG